MTFLYPNFLYALAAVAIPIIIHFFNFRKYKTIYFSDIRFIRNLEQQSSSKNRLKHIILLITRILIISLLVFAFARPYIPAKNENIAGLNYIASFYVDNSFSMQDEGKSGKLIEIAKSNAVDIARTFPKSTKFMLLTNEFSKTHNNLLNYDQFIDQLSKIEISSTSRKLTDVYNRQKDLHQSLSKNQHIEKHKIQYYWITDGQISTFNVEKIENTDSSSINIILLKSQNLGNIYIDSCWFSTPARVLNQSDVINIRIKNNSVNNYTNFPVNLFLNDSLKSVTSVNLKPNSSEIVEMKYNNNTKGFVEGKIEISDYPIIYDNALFFSYNIQEKVNILIINEKEENKYLDALFANDDYFNLIQQNKKNIDYSNFFKYQTIILNELKAFSSGFTQQLFDYVQKGGTALIIPAEKIEIGLYNKLLGKLGIGSLLKIDSIQLKIDEIVFEDLIYSNVFESKSNNLELPVVNKHWIIQTNANSFAKNILTLSNNNSFLVSANLKAGNTYLFALPFKDDFSDFAQNPIFVPTLYNIALYNQQNSKLYYQIGDREGIQLENKVSRSSIDNIRIQNIQQEYDNIANIETYLSGVSINLPTDIRKSGFYNIIQNESIIGKIAFNYNRLESDIRKYSSNELNEMLKLNENNNIKVFDSKTNNISESIYYNNFGKQLWKLFILMAIGLLAIEVILLRFFVK